MIHVVKDFHPYPKYCRVKDGEGSGEAFRKEHLLPKLQENEYVTVDLSGYNRYGPTFIREAFAGLILYNGYTVDELKRRLTIKHDMLPSIVELCWSLISDMSKIK